RSSDLFGEIEMRIAALQRIEGPRDSGDALPEHAIALSELQLMADVAVAVFGFDRQHVRVMDDPAMLEADEAVHETDHRALAPCSDQLSARFLCRDELRDRHDLAIVDAPHVLLQILDRADLVISFDVPNHSAA